MNPRYIPLIIAIALPLVFLIALTIAIYLPKAGIKPQYDFIYTSESPAWNSITYRYDINNGKIAPQIEIPDDVADLGEYSEPTYPTLYRYNVADDTAKVITLEEAQQLRLEAGPSSPDGYTVTYNYGHNGIFELFGSSNSNSGYFITKGAAQKKLPGIVSTDYWRGAIEVEGWVVNE
jgi:hypothetical protein